MDRFMDKYSIWLSTVVGIGVAVFLIINWDSAPITQKIVGLYFIAISLHEWEEMRLPGGFVDMCTSNLGFELKNPGAAKLMLFCAEMLVAFIPLFFPHVYWLCAAPIILGYIETLAHLLATRMNPKHRFYSPGMITALFAMLPISIWGTYELIAVVNMPALDWLWGLLFLLAIVLVGQRAIVTMNGMSYREFIANARKALLSKNKR